MTDKYLELGKAAVFRDTSRNGLLTNFLRDYKQQFGGGKLNPSCSSCRADYWNNYLNLFKMKKEVKCDYVLHKKYSGGVKLKFNGSPIRNGDMTNEQAEELLKTHPRGALLFSKMPKVKEIKVEKAEVIEPIKKTRKRKPKK